MSQLDLRLIPVTPFQQNCSLLWDTDTMEGVLVDPGGEPEKLMNTAKELGIDIKEIWLTHGHLDHAGGAEDIRKATKLSRSTSCWAGRLDFHSSLELIALAISAPRYKSLSVTTPFLSSSSPIRIAI